MSIADFTDAQREALLDLLVLAMYADGHLSSSEDARVQRLLELMGCASEYDRSLLFDASVTRVHKHSENPQAVQARLAELAKKLDTPVRRRAALGILEDLVRSDSRVAPEEHRFLDAVRNLFQG